MTEGSMSGNILGKITHTVMNQILESVFLTSCNLPSTLYLLEHLPFSYFTQHKDSGQQDVGAGHAPAIRVGRQNSGPELSEWTALLYPSSLVGLPSSVSLLSPFL